VAEQLSLAECKVGERFQLTRVIDQSPEFLRFLSSSGLPLGVSGRIVANTPEAGIVTISIDGQETTLGQAAAEKLLVTAATR
jgi:DtxR family Mn-dependent transcriptional regulator